MQFIYFFQKLQWYTNTIEQSKSFPGTLEASEVTLENLIS